MIDMKQGKIPFKGQEQFLRWVATYWGAEVKEICKRAIAGCAPEDVAGKIEELVKTLNERYGEQILQSIDTAELLKASIHAMAAAGNPTAKRFSEALRSKHPAEEIHNILQSL